MERCVQDLKNGGLSFTLPNGIRIFAQPCGDADEKQHGNGWASIDINAAYPNGDIEVLCCADYDAETGKLRVFAYDGTREAMAYECADFKFDEEAIQDGK